MNRFRRAKLALDAFRNFISKATIGQIGSQKFGFPNGTCRSNQQHHNPFLGGAKLFYGVEARGPRRWFQNRKVLLGSGIVITLYFGCETVPYTKRNHFVLLSRDMERKIGEINLDLMKDEELKGDILPANHPESVRVRLIFEALHRGLQHDLGFDCEVIVVDKPTVNAICFPGGKIVFYTGFLKSFKTDAEVATLLGHELAHAAARHPVENFTNMLLLFLPLIIHLLFLVAGIVNTISNILSGRLPSSRRYHLLSFFIKIPLTICVWLSAYGIGFVYLPRRMEMEADYIGLMLLASAGYDPRMAPKFYQKFGHDDRNRSALRKYRSTHPSGKKRAQLLSQAQVMQQALHVYMQSKFS